MRKGTVVALATGATAVGAAFGMLGQKYYDLAHTPEEKIAKLNIAKAESKQAKKEADEAKAANVQAYNKLVNTKEAYKKEVHDEIETQVRLELSDYISSADEKYAKAKKENELATLKLELAKQQNKALMVVHTNN